MFHKNGMRPLIITNCRICYSIVYCNSKKLNIGTKYVYKVISVKLDRLDETVIFTFSFLGVGSAIFLGRDMYFSQA